MFPVTFPEQNSKLGKGGCLDLSKKKEKVEKTIYIEWDTECDLCKFREECLENLIECTNEFDTRQHFVRGLGVGCKKLSRLREVHGL